jgi:hypothetical protein
MRTLRTKYRVFRRYGARRGIGLLEVLILGALVALATIGLVRAFTNTTKGQLRADALGQLNDVRDYAFTKLACAVTVENSPCLTTNPTTAFGYLTNGLAVDGSVVIASGASPYYSPVGASGPYATIYLRVSCQPGVRALWVEAQFSNISANITRSAGGSDVPSGWFPLLWVPEVCP